MNCVLLKHHLHGIIILYTKKHSDTFQSSQGLEEEFEDFSNSFSANLAHFESGSMQSFFPLTAVTLQETDRVQDQTRAARESSVQLRCFRKASWAVPGPFSEDTASMHTVYWLDSNLHNNHNSDTCDLTAGRKPHISDEEENSCGSHTVLGNSGKPSFWSSVSAKWHIFSRSRIQHVS